MMPKNSNSLGYATLNFQNNAPAYNYLGQVHLQDKASCNLKQINLSFMSLFGLTYFFGAHDILLRQSK